ncbi:MAG: sulfatase-like hydrolase/transferase [Bacteroidota bacterium]
MKLNPFFVVLLSNIILFSCQSEKTEEKEPSLPNIILLVGDDQGYPYFGFMGADYVQTPNMDALVANGTLFTDGYVSDNHCRPSLQTLLTGILPIDYYKKSEDVFQRLVKEKNIPEDSLVGFKRYFDLRALALPAFETLPEMLAEKGYVSFQGGKWWEFTYQNGGFTHGMTKGWTEQEQKTTNWFHNHMGGDGMDLARVTNQPAYDFIEEAGENPFFIWFAPSLPHYPFDAPEKYYTLYKDQDMSESAKQYYANCTWFDDAWGEMVDYLKEKNLYENTLIVYVNDNGWEQEPKQEYWDDPMRSHNGGDKGKSSLYDMSFRSPIIFALGDEIPQGVRTEALIHSADIPATILDYVGVEVPDHFYGKSFRPVIEGKEKGLRDVLQGNIISNRSKDPNNVMGDNVEGYWVRQDNWFLRWHVTYDELELFDLNTDLRNDHNVAEEHPEVLTELWEKAKAYKAEKGDDPRLAYYQSLKNQE